MSEITIKVDLHDEVKELLVKILKALDGASNRASKPSEDAAQKPSEAPMKDLVDTAAQRKADTAARRKAKAAAKKELEAEENAKKAKKAAAEAMAKAAAEAKAKLEEAEADPFGDDEFESKSYSKEDVRRALRKYANENDKQGAIKLLKDAGASSLGELDEEKYAEVVEACNG